MSSLITLDGHDVQKGRLSLGLHGAGWADLEISTDEVPVIGTQMPLTVAGGLTWQGTVRYAGEYLQTTQVRLVGGAGGLGASVIGAYRGAVLGDVLAEIMRASGETQSGTIASSVLSVPLDRWTLGESTATRALDELAEAASLRLETSIGWRVLADGTVWMGAESWATQALPDDHVISKRWPDEGRTLLGCASPSILPGVDLEGVGRVAGVDHNFTVDAMRSTVWTEEQRDPIDKLAAAVLERLGLNYTGAPRLERLQLARARVDAIASDGSTVDVTPESGRLSPMQKIPLRQTAARAKLKTGARVQLAWEGGSSGGIVAQPVGDDGATFAEVKVNADAINLNSGTKGAARVDDNVKVSAISAATTSSLTFSVVDSLGVSGTINITVAAGALAVVLAPLTMVGPFTHRGPIIDGSSTVKVG